MSTLSPRASHSLRLAVLSQGLSHSGTLSTRTAARYPTLCGGPSISGGDGVLQTGRLVYNRNRTTAVYLTHAALHPPMHPVNRRLSRPRRDPPDSAPGGFFCPFVRAWPVFPTVCVLMGEGAVDSTVTLPQSRNSHEADMDNTMQIPCFYCDGTGYAGDRQTDADTFEPSGQCCAECQGTGVSSRVAGARYTGYPRVSDPLLRLLHLRTHYLNEARSPPYTASYRRPSVDECRALYENARAAACRAVGGAR